MVRRSRDAGARHGLARTAGGPAGPLRGREGSGAVSVQKRAIVQKRALPWGISFAAALVLAFACTCSKKDARAGATPEAAPVTVASVARQDVPVEVRAIGHVEPFTTVALKARVGGQVIRVGFQQGQDVRKGDLLFQIDPRPYQAALAQARAQLERDRAIARNAEDDVKRYTDLVKKDYVTREQYDSTRAAAAAAVATTKSDEAAVENAQLQLSYCTVAAPMSGRTGSVLVNPGNMVKGNDDNPLVVLNQVQPVYVSFSVPESSLAQIRQRLRPGEKLKVLAAASGNPSNTQTGELSFLNNAVDPGTGTILLKATFPNENEALWPGEYVDVVLTLATEAKAIVVPAQAVQTGQAGQYVWVVKNDLTVESRPVTLSRTQGPLAIVAKGLEEGERVVTDGQLRLAPGTKVQVRKVEGKTA
ncbi:MAG: efflux RND transporter periplasmic adaptor subunit [Acidobacteria bacterium]|nr:MAG: efflux RND transporter periplasmic adaptor subunit [Acidobacteriota bacterium]